MARCGGGLEHAAGANVGSGDRRQVFSREAPILVGKQAARLAQPGTVERVRNTLVEEYKRFPSEYLTLIYHYAQMPKEEVLRQLHIFMKEIKPALDELAEYPAEPSVAAAGGGR